jgi:NAD(P)-dependent dehydrogenase (short-subunit alcohol dehydrogenase family)
MARERGFSLGTLLLGARLGYMAYQALNPPKEADMAGQVVLITGGSRGLGLLLARELALLGSRIAICARRPDELEAARAELEALGAQVLAVPCDVADRDQVNTMVNQVTARFGRIDVLVNNASIIQVGPLDSLTLQDFESAMDVNFWGVVNTTWAVLPAMRAQRSGRVVTIDSIGGRVAVPHLLPYDAAKFAARGFSEGLRAELAGTGVHVTTILPGLMRTGSPLNATFKGQHALEFLWFAAADSVPLLAMSAERAAHRIVQAIRRGETEVTLTWQARTLGLLHDLFPSTTQATLGLVNRLLPKSAGPTGAIAGRDIQLPETVAPLRRRLEELGDRTHQRVSPSIW